MTMAQRRFLGNFKRRLRMSESQKLEERTGKGKDFRLGLK